MIADQSRMRGADLPVLHPGDDVITELRMLTAHRTDLVADRTRTINRLRQQLVAVCPALERAAQLTQDRGWVVLLARYQRPKAIRQSGLSRLTRVLADARGCVTPLQSQRRPWLRRRPRRCACRAKKSPLGWSHNWPRR
ncbi:hypothetical protein MBOU_30940 [Mycobacterium bourgelatii]|uniref:Transposase IS110-like N-terminal domain-containing protein n=1 Tax=Mycobacterium bourgelatii TaxID=1273442 RepID=A0A7I9YR33_MYCBU|nr:hypothetical protein MBOU_30940 [Mycobacterium bourgelatii]